VRSIDRIDWL